MPTMFLSLDGVDGAGKSTQLRLLNDWLREQGCEPILCRDPGSTPLGEAVREILLQRCEIPIHRRSEMLLYMAARAQLVEQVLRPTLERGGLVLCDRYLLANVVYQGHAGGLDVDQLWQVGRIATGGLMPDLTVVLDMPAEQAARRIAREPDRMESQGLDYLERVRRGFLLEAGKAPQQIRIVDAAREVDQVQRELRELVWPLVQPAA